MSTHEPAFDFRRRSAVSREKLRAASAVDVTHSLLVYCDQTAADFPDFDEAMKVGLLLQEAPSNCAEALMDWLAPEVTPVRLDLTCALLYGLWIPNPRVPPPTFEVVAKLAALRPSDRTEPDADYSYALVMGRVLENTRTSNEAAALARHELVGAVKRGTGDASLDQSLFGMSRRHVPNTPHVGNEFQAYVVSADSSLLYVVEAAASHDQLVEVLELSESANVLRIRYRKVNPALSNIVAVDALEAALLVNLLEREHRGRISSVEYVDETANFRVIAPYPE
jgi:hypothetical protein